MPRTVTAHMFSTANGVCESPNLFQFDAFGQEEGEMMGRTLAGVTDVVIGRKLWQEWSQFWQSVDANDPFGSFINPARKHVVSTTLRGDLGWNSTGVEGDPAEHVRRLRDQDGGGIVVVGGIETVRLLFLAGVVDTLTLTIHPVVTGEGRRLFDESTPLTRLALTDSAITPAGNAIVTYSRSD
jgi:dihydrofolate reductase